ncbi:ROK family protein [Rhizobium mongolense]|nr:ROK family protein [Rhizobium mongolense]
MRNIEQLYWREVILGMDKAAGNTLFGVGRDHRDFAALAIGAGIGCSLVIKGEIYHGSHSAAGKLGHTTSVPNGRLCECGRRGCLMAHAAEPYMLDQWQSRSGSSISRDEFARSVERQEDLALSILSDCGSRIGRHLADIVNLFDPEIIVVGGEAVQFGDALLDPIRKTMEEFAFFTKPELCSLSRAAVHSTLPGQPSSGIKRQECLSSC